jgi:hypothetical protein
MANGNSLFGESQALEPEEQRVLELLAQQRQQAASGPPAPPKVSKVRRAFGAIGDALTARGAVLAGGSAPALGGFARVLESRQQQYRIDLASHQEAQQQLQDDVVRAKIDMEEASMKRRLDEEAAIRAGKRQDEFIRARQEDQDKRLAGRQQDDDERDAAIALGKTKIDEVGKIIDSLTEAGIPDNIIPDIDPRLLTIGDIVDLKLRAQQLITGKEPPSAAERIKAQEEEVQKALPGARVTSIAFTGKDGTPNARFAKDPLTELTAPEQRLLANAGVNPFDEEGNPRDKAGLFAQYSAIKKAEEEQKSALRDARLNAAIKGKGGEVRGTVRMKIAENMDILQDAMITKRLLEGLGGAPGGPVSGVIPPNLRYAMVSLFLGPEVGNKNRQVSIKLTRIKNVILKIRSGAAVTEPEEIRQLPELPNITDLKGTMLAKLDEMIDHQQRFIGIIKQAHGLEDADVSFVGNVQSGTMILPGQLEPDDIVIFGGTDDAQP